MFKISRRNILVFSLVIVLCCISYLNFAINKYSLLETSSELEKYEENKLAEFSSDGEPPGDAPTEETSIGDAISMGDAEDVAVVDSKGSDVENMLAEASATIEDSIVTNSQIRKRNFFIESRLNTSIERERIVTLLNEMISNEKTDEQNRKAANNEKMKLIDIMNKERIIENLIKAKGYEDALVFITDHSVNVIVETEKITDSDMAKILDIVTRETKVPFDNIKILNKF